MTTRVYRWRPSLVPKMYGK